MLILGQAPGRADVRAIFLVFFFEALALGQWIPRIPDVKSALQLSDAQLGLGLLSLPLGTLLAFTVSGRIVQRTGLRNACRVFLPLWAVLLISPAFAQSLVQLMIALAISGFAVGMIETAMNTEAARIENSVGKRLMSRCHGCWSIGTMIGALVGGIFAHNGISVGTHFLLVMPLIAIGGYIAATSLPLMSKLMSNETISHPVSQSEAPSSSEQDEQVSPVELAPSPPEVSELSSADKGELFALPSRAIMLLCIMPLGIMTVEGAFIDWSAVFMRDVMAASPLLVAVTYSFFSIVMAAVRLSGDYITDRVGEVMVVRASGLAATLGISLFALAPSTLWVFVGAAISGAGVAIVFPLAVTAAANRPGNSPAHNVAALNIVAFTAFLAAPPLIGFMSEAMGLRLALLCLAPLAFATFLLADETRQAGDRQR